MHFLLQPHKKNETLLEKKYFTTVVLRQLYKDRCSKESGGNFVNSCNFLKAISSKTTLNMLQYIVFSKPPLKTLCFHFLLLAWHVLIGRKLGQPQINKKKKNSMIAQHSLVILVKQQNNQVLAANLRKQSLINFCKTI